MCKKKDIYNYCSYCHLVKTTSNLVASTTLIPTPTKGNLCMSVYVLVLIYIFSCLFLINR